MPDRILRAGILSSDRVNTLGAHAELLYRRLMSVVDDYGRFDARPTMLRVACFPLRVEQVREADISRWLAEVQTAGLIALYVVDGKEFVEMVDTKWQRRSQAKYPGPEDRQVCEVGQSCAQPARSLRALAHSCRSRCRCSLCVEKKQLSPANDAGGEPLLPPPAPPPEADAPPIPESSPSAPKVRQVRPEGQVSVAGQKPAAAPAAPAAPAKPRDPFWDAVVKEFGLSPVTKTELGRVGKIVRDLKLKAALPEQIPKAIGRYRAYWPKAVGPDGNPSPEAVLKHWDVLTKPGKQQAQADYQKTLATFDAKQQAVQQRNLDAAKRQGLIK